MPEELSRLELELEVDPWFSLSELRIAPDGRKVLIPHTRLKKPEATKVESKECVFCPSSPSMSKPPYTLADFVQGARDREISFLKNKFPTVSSPEISDAVVRYHTALRIIYDRQIARGKHLVMIETPDHYLNPFTATRKYYENLVWGYITMLKTLRAEGFQLGLLGKNYNGVNKDGTEADAGASQKHLHSQAVGVDSLLLPDWVEDTMKYYHASTIVVPQWLEYIVEQSPVRIIVPRWLKYIVNQSKIREIELEEDFFGEILPGCSSCIESRFNRGFGPIKIADDNLHISFVNPIPSSRAPYDFEIYIMPFAHQGLFDEMSKLQADSFADILNQTMVWTSSKFGECGYNYMLFQGPWKISDHPRWEERYKKIFHWKFVVHPASSELDTIKTQGFMSELLGIPILKKAPEDIAYRPRQ